MPWGSLKLLSGPGDDLESHSCPKGDHQPCPSFQPFLHSFSQQTFTEL